MSKPEYHLLLQSPEGEDALDAGIEDIDGGHGDEPKREVKPGKASDSLGADRAPLNSLAQGWGVLYPQGREDLLEAIAPLRALREQQVADEWKKYETGPVPTVRSWAIAPGATANDFIRDVYNKLRFEERPYYLLILGDFDEISVDFQMSLTGRAAVGRVCFREVAGHFDELEGYRRYAKKIVDSEQTASSSRAPKLVLFSSSDEHEYDRAVDHGHAHLIEPTRRRVAESLYSPYYSGGAPLVGPKSEDAKLRSWGDLGSLTSGEQPSVLLSLSHGAGNRRWDAVKQRELQGSLKLDRTTTLDPLSLAQGRFLPGGAWFYFACFGAGTPSKTAFEAWLNELYRLEVYSRVPNVLQTLARERPFVARTPMMALANPEGPLMVFAHADLAFVYGYSTLAGQQTFTSADGAVVANPFEGGQPFVSEVLEKLGKGMRGGYAIRRLDQVVQHLESTLTSAASEEARANEGRKRELLELARQPEGTASVLSERVRDAVRAALDKYGHGTAIKLSYIAEAGNMSLRQFYEELGDGLPTSQQSRTAMVARSHQFMARNDIRGFILLGDPAASVALSSNRPRRQRSREELMGSVGLSSSPAVLSEPAPAPAPQHGSGLSVNKAESVVLELINGTTTSIKAAGQLGLEDWNFLDELKMAYVKAGREAIKKLLNS